MGQTINKHSITRVCLSVCWHSHGRIPWSIFAKICTRNTMTMLDFRPEVEIRHFRACALKTMQYIPYLWPNRGNSRVL